MMRSGQPDRRTVARTDRRAQHLYTVLVSRVDGEGFALTRETWGQLWDGLCAELGLSQIDVPAGAGLLLTLKQGETR